MWRWDDYITQEHWCCFNGCFFNLILHGIDTWICAAGRCSVVFLLLLKKGAYYPLTMLGVFIRQNEVADLHTESWRACQKLWFHFVVAYIHKSPEWLNTKASESSGSTEDRISWLLGAVMCWWSVLPSKRYTTCFLNLYSFSCFSSRVLALHAHCHRTPNQQATENVIQCCTAKKRMYCNLQKTTKQNRYHSCWCDIMIENIYLKAWFVRNILQQRTDGLHKLSSSNTACVILPVHIRGFWIFVVVSTHLFDSLDLA